MQKYSNGIFSVFLCCQCLPGAGVKLSSGNTSKAKEATEEWNLIFHFVAHLALSSSSSSRCFPSSNLHERWTFQIKTSHTVSSQLTLEAPSAHHRNERVQGESSCAMKFGYVEKLKYELFETEINEWWHWNNVEMFGIFFSYIFF